MKVLKEACVGSFLEAKKACELGADRIELCDNLKKVVLHLALVQLEWRKKF